MRTSYRDIALLACCQALLLINNSGLIAMNGLVGYALVDNKTFATLGATSFVVGSALAAMPAALWMAKVGRRRGFMTGSAIAVAGAATCALALWLGSFALFCFGTAVIGIYTAFGLQYRFAAAEVAAPEFRAKAISLVLAGGIAGGFLGPQASLWAMDLLPVRFLGSFLVLSAIAIVALAVQSQVRVPPPSMEETRGGGRPLARIARQPVFIVAALSAALGYGIMNLLMTATPLAMSFCGHPFSAAAFVIEWHVVGMYAPGFFTGSLIKRFGALKVIAVGIVLMGACVAVALSGIALWQFWTALLLLGVGWNFMYTGGTTLLIDAYTPAEKAKTQGMNDVIIFTVMSISSFSSGALISAAGWDWMNLGTLPLLAVVASAVLWVTLWRRRARVTRNAKAT
ncbi:MAG TPA: MFS transporter [Casimicrobiaceae bacterium]|nr:MFS transporter [Casimicrobiaceae bacterium]